MDHLSLVKSGTEVLEKRTFPRFPFSFLTFKALHNDENRVFAVRDINYQGMQLTLKNGGHQYRVGDLLTGALHWKKVSTNVEGKVVWVKGERLGVSFEETKTQEDLKSFLCVDNIVASFRPLHKEELGIELPSNLMCWLQADGPMEIFVWRHTDGEISGFHIILMDTFIEYVDGKGLRSGVIPASRDVETPLNSEEEFEFLVDEKLDQDKLNFAREIIKNIPENFCSDKTRDFLSLKVGLHAAP
jgi:hypothetical protein